jgi:hypothetical protein
MSYDEIVEDIKDTVRTIKLVIKNNWDEKTDECIDLHQQLQRTIKHNRRLVKLLSRVMKPKYEELLD